MYVFLDSLFHVILDTLASLNNSIMSSHSQISEKKVALMQNSSLLILLIGLLSDIL